MSDPSIEAKQLVEKERGEEKRGKSWRREREDRGRKLGNGPAPAAVPTVRSGSADGSGSCSTADSSDASSSRHDSTGDECDRDGSNKSTAQIRVDDSVAVQVEEVAIQAEENHDEESKSAAEEEISFLDEKLNELRARLDVKMQMRLNNKTAALNRPEEDFFTKLDSSLKRNTAFVKKLKSITELQRDLLVKEMNGLNLTRYVGEVADAIVEAKLKMSDISSAINICSILHQRYAEFSVMLLEKWHRILTIKKDEKVSNPSKLRVDLRFYAELISAGVFTHKEGLPLLGSLLTTLINMDKDEHNNLPIILSFCKHCGEDYCGLVSRRVRLLAEKYGREIPRSELLTVERQKNVRSLMKDYYGSLCSHLIKSHKDIQASKRQNRRILQTKGELSLERREKFENAEIAFQKLLANTQIFADTLDEIVPTLPEDESMKGDSDSFGGIDVHNRFKNNEFQFDNDTSPWEDEDTRNFYENLPDLKAFIPGILFKDSVATGPAPTEKIPDESAQVDAEEIEVLEELETKAPLEEEGNSEVTTTETSTPEAPATVVPEIEDVVEEVEVTGSTAGRVLLDAFVVSLPHCVNRELIDKAAVEFCLNLNTKPNRKKLTKALFLVPRTRLDLLPFYSRLVATLNPCMPDIAVDLAQLLKQDFKHHVAKKDQINIESKVKTVRFIGEMVKFKMYSKAEALFCLKVVLTDFTHHHIEMTCHLLETCGRYLFRSPESHQRTKVFLDQMMRKKAVMAMDCRYVTMVENAFYYCDPPEVPPSVRKERPPMYEYVRKLLFRDLDKSSTERVLRQIRKLSWDDVDLVCYTTKCLVAIWNVKYYNIRCVANLLAGLVAHKEHVGPHVVDGVLEEIRIGMEINLPKFNQRRVSAVRFLGELYNYRMVESAVIFKVLYSFITFDVLYDGTPSELDPPEHLFRLRLVCNLLDTCGQYFNSGSSLKKLDCFLSYFQRYFWFKRTNENWSEENVFPVTVEFMIRDTITSLRPKLKLFESYEEAQQAIADLEQELISSYNEVFLSLKKSGQGGQADGLETVQETDEDDGGGGDDDESSGESDSDGDDDDLHAHSPSQPMEYRDRDDGPDVTGNSQPADGDALAADEENFLPGRPRHISCAEDEDFMNAFDKMMAENIQHRNQESVKVPQVDVLVPVNVKSNIKKPPGTIQMKYNSEQEDKDTINFILMTRKGGKQQYKSLEIPTCSELALNLKDRKEAERAEKEKVKRLTLDINERQEEEDYQEMLASQQRPTTMNLNRERRQKYQHPKGAPDADLIFGNK